LVDDALGLLLVVPEAGFALLGVEFVARRGLAADVKESPGAG
jgi:hypothetical protein